MKYYLNSPQRTLITGGSSARQDVEKRKSTSRNDNENIQNTERTSTGCPEIPQTDESFELCRSF